MSETATGTSGAWSYRTGDWFAVFGTNATVLLPASQKDQVVALWALVDGGAAFDEVLDGLLASGLSRIPGFVLVSTDEGPTRVLLRGQGVTAALSTAAEDVALDGSASHTWVERSVEGVTALSVHLPAAEDAAEESADFPIATGLVRVTRVDRPALVPAASAAAPEAEATPLAAEPVEAIDVLAEEAVPEEPAAGAVEEPAAELLDEPTVPPVLAEPAAEAVEELAEEPAEEASPLDDSPETEVMEVVGDPLSDPIPPAPPLPPVPSVPPVPPVPPVPAPDGWVTPWDSPADPPADPPADQPAEPDAEPAADAAEEPERDTPAVPSLPPAGETEVPPVSGWVPPPPPSPSAPGVPDAPPLPVGSWEPVGGAGAPPAPAEPAAFDPDHDGQTITGAGPGVPAPATPGIPGQPPAPAVTQPVAKLLVSDGQTIVVDRAVLVGRAPEARRFTSSEQPTLVTVPSRLHEISSTHIEIRPGTGADHGTAVVTDMGSTNGTVLVQPGLGPEDLKPGIAVQLIPGAIINLGDGITIQVTRP